MCHPEKVRGTQTPANQRHDQHSRENTLTFLPVPSQLDWGVQHLTLGELQGRGGLSAASCAGSATAAAAAAAAA